MKVYHRLKMNLPRREIRALLFHEFHLSRKTTNAANNIGITMGGDVLSIHTSQYWSNCVKNGNLQLDDLPRSGRSLKLDVDLLKQLMEEDFR